MKPMMVGIWFLIGFITATFLYSEIKGPWVIVTLFSGLAFRWLFQKLLLDTIFGGEIDQASHWAQAHPIPIQIWYHAKQWALGLHQPFRIRDCPKCGLVN